MGGCKLQLVKKQHFGKYRDLESALQTWFSCARSQNAVVTNAVLRQKAKQFGPDLGISPTDFHYYVAAKATYIRLLHGKIGILEGFFGPSSVHRGRTHIVLG